MIEVKPSMQCFDGIFQRKKKKKGKSFFVNVLDRKTQAWDNGSTKKKSASSRWCFKCWMRCISKGGSVLERQNMQTKWQGTECKSAHRAILKTGPVQTQAQAPSSNFSKFSSKQKLTYDFKSSVWVHTSSHVLTVPALICPNFWALIAAWMPHSWLEGDDL